MFFIPTSPSLVTDINWPETSQLLLKSVSTTLTVLSVMLALPVSTPSMPWNSNNPVASFNIYMYAEYGLFLWLWVSGYITNTFTFICILKPKPKPFLINMLSGIILWLKSNSSVIVFNLYMYTAPQLVYVIAPTVTSWPCALAAK